MQNLRIFQNEASLISESASVGHMVVMRSMNISTIASQKDTFDIAFQVGDCDKNQEDVKDLVIVF